MAEVLRVVLSAVQLRPLRSHPEPVVMRGITLAPKHGVRVEVERRATVAPGDRAHRAVSPA